ncbi:hypothetical protein BGZ97_007739, partial [Linnemannia gamsii]
MTGRRLFTSSVFCFIVIAVVLVIQVLPGVQSAPVAASAAVAHIQPNSAEHEQVLVK